MEHYIEIEIPAKKEQKLIKRTCDLCGDTIYPREKFDAEEVEIIHTTGNSYPEGGSGEKIKVDMCGNCFDKKLIPWLLKQGCNPVKTEWDW